MRLLCRRQTKAQQIPMEELFFYCPDKIPPSVHFLITPISPHKFKPLFLDIRTCRLRLVALPRAPVRSSSAARPPASPSTHGPPWWSGPPPGGARNYRFVRLSMTHRMEWFLICPGKMLRVFYFLIVCLNQVHYICNAAIKFQFQTQFSHFADNLNRRTVCSIFHL